MALHFIQISSISNMNYSLSHVKLALDQDPSIRHVVFGLSPVALYPGRHSYVRTEPTTRSVTLMAVPRMVGGSAVHVSCAEKFRVYDLLSLAKTVMPYTSANNFLDILGILKIFANLKTIFIDNGGGGV